MRAKPNMPPGLHDEPPVDDEHVDIKEAAKLLQVSRVVLESLLSKGRLGAVSAGEEGRLLVLLSAVIDYKSRRRARRLEALEKVTEHTKKMGLYDEELDELGLQRESDGRPTE